MARSSSSGVAIRYVLPVLFAVVGSSAGTVDQWSVSNYGSPDGVSVSPSGNVVIAVRDTGQLVILSPTGQVVKHVKLPTELVSPRHAIQLAGGDDRYLLCHGWATSVYGICVVDGNGRITKSAASGPAQRDGAAVAARAKSFTPTYLAVDGRGNVLAAEFTGCAVQQYSKALDYIGDAVVHDDDDDDDGGGSLHQPFRLCVDQTSGRLYVGEFGGQTRVIAFDSHIKQT